MSWAKQLREAAIKGAGAPAKPKAAKIGPAKRKPKPVVYETYAQVRGPSGNDPGEVTIGYYTLEGDLLTMTDEKGNPIGRADEVRFQDGDDPKRIASRLTWKRYQADRGGDFNRSLGYAEQGWR